LLANGLRLFATGAKAQPGGRFSISGGARGITAKRAPDGTRPARDANRPPYKGAPPRE